ncbi:MAG: helix-turn-helix domain-containing protein, partial [Betaproteobacteria bacterium]
AWAPVEDVHADPAAEYLGHEPLSANPARTAEQPAASGLQWAVRHSELRVILDAIRNTNSREAAARVLGISPRTLRYKLAQMRDLGMMTAEAAN